MTRPRKFLCFPQARFVLVLLLSFGTTAAKAEAAHGGGGTDVIHLRAWALPNEHAGGPIAEAQEDILRAFVQRYPNVELHDPEGLRLPGALSMDMVPFMQIAGDIAPDVMF